MVKLAPQIAGRPEKRGVEMPLTLFVGQRQAVTGSTEWEKGLHLQNHCVVSVSKV